MYVASLLFVDSTDLLTFTVANIDRGYIANAPHPTGSALTSPGSDARRFRIDSVLYQEFGMDTVADFATYDEAVTAAQLYERNLFGVATLTVNASNYAGKSFNVQAIECAPRVQYGFSGGAIMSSSTSPKAFISCAWRLVCTGA